jgi:phenylalanyl-tRNA synthetase alpha chain
MINKIKEIINEVENYHTTSIDEIEHFRLKYISKKGIITELFEQFKIAAPEKKKEIGAELNILKQKALAKIENLKASLVVIENNAIDIDLTRPGDPINLGSRHPITIVKNDIINIFSRIGFNVSDGSEIEDDAHNFGMLNFAQDHPARDMQDTFFIAENMNILLRTHTSSVQAHEMSELKPPIRSLSPGRVYRNEAISARSNCFFHQIEGLYVDKNVSFADLRQSLNYFAKEFFGADVKTRLRPSYFPFTEPSAEMDVSCTLCKGKGCNVCKGSGWLEIMGCGMVDPRVFISTGINHEIYSGFAFGIGIDRTAMLKYGINDLRIFFENDIKFLNQFADI